MANVDEIGFFSHAEALGYHAVWVTDSQMLFSDCYAVLALAAKQTSRLHLGPGTAICGMRIPPVHVAAMATLNRLAPGRVHLGIGTGNTATRTMGQRPMKIADYREYLRVVRALLDGETVEYEYGGVRKPIRMLMADRKYVSLTPRIPLYVSGFGPRAMELAGEFGDGLVFAIPPRGVPVPEALGHAAAGAKRAGRAVDGFRNCALTNIALLEPGEAVDSPRIIETIGPTSWPPSTICTTTSTSGAASRRRSSRGSGSATARSSSPYRPSTATSAPTSSITHTCTPARPSCSTPISSVPPAWSAPPTSWSRRSANWSARGCRS
jgi:hypothetical protein